MKFMLSIVQAFTAASALACVALNSARAQSPSSAYDSMAIVQRINALKLANQQGESIPELERICEQAAAHQDAAVVAQLASIEFFGTIRVFALDELKKMPVPAQKRAMVNILRDTSFWQFDEVGSRRRTGQFILLSRARGIASQLLGRDLRQFSPDYDPDPKKQMRAEGLNLSPVFISPEGREQAAIDLLSQ